MGGITTDAVEDGRLRGAGITGAALPARDPVLAEIEAEAAKRNIPIVGPVVGRILQQYAMMIGARTVFEMGSAVGYSTICWARAVGKGGRVHYTDGDRKNAAEAEKVIGRQAKAA